MLVTLGIQASAQPNAASLVLPALDDRIPVTDRPPQNDPDDFQFLIVADRTGGHRPGVFREAVDKVNLLRPEFVLSVGDLIEGYTEDEALIRQQWDEFDVIAEGFESPFFYVPGNHDLTNEVMARVWKERYGRSYYHFLYRDVLFLCLNTEDGGLGELADEQIAYAKRVLASHADARWTFVMMHSPIFHDGYGKPHPDWKAVADALGDRDFTVFAGHWHAYRRAEVNDQRYYILATTGGGSRLRGKAFGEFDHVVWVTMTHEGPRVVNLALEGILREDFLTSEQYNEAYELSSAYTVALDPTPRGDQPFERGHVTLRIENRADLPLRLTGRFGPSGGLHVHPHGVDATVGPHTSRKIEIELASPAGPLTGAVPAVPFDGHLTYEAQQRKEPLRFPIHAVAALYQPQPLARSTSALTIDGNLEDWPALPFHVGAHHGQLIDSQGAWTGPGDCAYRFAAASDDDALYLAIAVTDEAAVLSADRYPWDQDGVEIRIDPRDDPARSANRGPDAGYNKDFLFLAFAVSADGKPLARFRPEAWPEGVKLATRRVAKGYAAELRIPHTALDACRAGATPWSALRLNIAVNDVDDAGGSRAQLWWQPDWRGSQNRPGSGTLTRP